MRRISLGIASFVTVGALWVLIGSPTNRQEGLVRQVEAQSPLAWSNFLPLLFNFEDGRSGFQIQNVSSDTSIVISANMRHSSDLRAVSIGRLGINPGWATNVFLPAEPTLEHTIYSADILADGPIRSIARVDWLDTGGAALYSDAPPGKEILLPLVAKDFAGQMTTFAIQNTDARSAISILVEFMPYGSAVASTSARYSLDPTATQIIDLSSDKNFEDLPSGALGFVRITSDASPVAAAAITRIFSPENSSYGYSAALVDDASENLFVPLIRNDYFGTTGIALVNPGSEAVEVTLRYDASPGAESCSGSYEHSGGSHRIEAGTGAVFYQGNIESLATGPSSLPKGCFGSAVITASGGKIMAVVNDADVMNGSASAYKAFGPADASRSFAMPLFRKEHVKQKLTTGIQVMNTSLEPAEVHLEVSFAGHNTPPADDFVNVTIPPLGTHTWFPSSSDSRWDFMPANSFGSARLSSDQPILAIVNDFSVTGAWDSAIYSGFPLE